MRPDRLLRQKATDIYIFIMLLVYPLVPGTKGYTNITATKLWFWLGVTAAWLLALLVLWILERRGPGRIGPAQLFAAGFIIVCCVSALLSDFGRGCLIGYGRYDGLLTMVLYAVTLVCVAAFGAFRTAHLAAFAVSITVCAVISFLQVLGRDPFDLFPYDYIYYDAHYKFASEFIGTIGNVDLMSTLLCLAVPLFAASAITRRRGLWLLLPLFAGTANLLFAGAAAGYVGMAAAVLVLMPLLLTDASRLRRAFACAGSMALAAALKFSLRADYTDLVLTIDFRLTAVCALALAGALACFVMALLPFWRSLSFSEKAARRFFLILDGAAVLLGLAVLWFWPGTSGTMYELSQVLHGHIDPKFGSSRIMIWQGVFPLIREHPLLGAGPGTISQRVDVSFSRFVEETGKTLSVSVDNAHCVYLQILADTGLAGLVCYIGALLCAMLTGLKKRAPLVLAVFCCCVQDLFGLGLFITAPFLWIFAGLCASDRQITGGSHEKTD